MTSSVINSLLFFVWCILLAVFCILICIGIIRHFRKSKNNEISATSVEAVTLPGKISALRKAIIGTGMLVVIPLIIVIIASLRLFTFDYKVSETTARDIEKYIISNNHSNSEEIVSWNTIFGRIYADDCIYLSEYSDNSPALIKKASAVIVENINLSSLRLGCSPFEVTYFNANGNFLANCPGDLACLLIGHYDINKADYIYPGIK